MKKIFKIIIFIAIGIIVLVGIIGFVMGQITKHECKNLCEENNALHSWRIHNGELNLRDTCICFYEDKIKSFTLFENG